jgi:hypothetical protein
MKLNATWVENFADSSTAIIDSSSSGSSVGGFSR